MLTLQATLSNPRSQQAFCIYLNRQTICFVLFPPICLPYHSLSLLLCLPLPLPLPLPLSPFPFPSPSIPLSLSLSLSLFPSPPLSLSLFLSQAWASIVSISLHQCFRCDPPRVLTRSNSFLFRWCASAPVYLDMGAHQPTQSFVPSN